MQTQRDHVHAYSFLMGRMSMALVLGELSGPDIPAQRARRGFLIGILIALLIMLGFFLYGLIMYQRAPKAAPPAAVQQQQAVRPQAMGGAPLVGPMPGQSGTGRGQAADDAAARTAGVSGRQTAGSPVEG
jgi:hypothetical protein